MMNLPRRDFLRLAAGATAPSAVLRTARAQAYPPPPFSSMNSTPAVSIPKKAPFGGRQGKCGREVRHRRRLSDHAPSLQSPIKPIFDLFGVRRDRLLA
jgi:hypothetical protein